MLSSSMKLKNNDFIVLHSVPGQGKTVTACSLSEFFPATLPAEKPVELSDVVLLEYDLGGTESLRALNLDVPTYDLAREYGNIRELEKLERDVFKEVKERIADGVTKTVIIDTVSARDGMLYQFYNTGTGLEIRQYGSILGANTAFAWNVKALPCFKVACFHSKVLSTLGDESDKAKKRQGLGVSNNVDVLLDITGQGGSVYRRDSNGIFCVVKKNGGTGKPDQYNIRTAGVDTIELKCRYGKLNSVEPANLRKLLQKAGSIQ